MTFWMGMMGVGRKNTRKGRNTPDTSKVLIKLQFLCWKWIY